MSHDFLNTISSARDQSQTGILARYFDNWQARKAVRSLLKLDDHILHDLGAARSDVDWAAHLPLHVNAALALEDKINRTIHN